MTACRWCSRRRGSAAPRPDRARRSTTRSPARSSPNVLLRPVVERAILPTVAYVGGPGRAGVLRAGRPPSRTRSAGASASRAALVGHDRRAARRAHARAVSSVDSGRVARSARGGREAGAPSACAAAVARWRCRSPGARGEPRRELDAARRSRRRRCIDHAVVGRHAPQHRAPARAPRAARRRRRKRREAEPDATSRTLRARRCFPQANDRSACSTSCRCSPATAAAAGRTCADARARARGGVRARRRIRWTRRPPSTQHRRWPLSRARVRAVPERTVAARRCSSRPASSSAASSASSASACPRPLPRARRRRRRVQGGVPHPELPAEPVRRGRALGVVHPGVRAAARAKGDDEEADASRARWLACSRSSPRVLVAGRRARDAVADRRSSRPGSQGAKRELTITLVRILFPGVGAARALGVVPRRPQQPPPLLPLVRRAGALERRDDRGADRLRPRLVRASDLVDVPRRGARWSAAAAAVLRAAADRCSRSSRRFARRSRSRARACARCSRNFVPGVRRPRRRCRSAATSTSCSPAASPPAPWPRLHVRADAYLLPVSLFGMSVSAAELPAMSARVGDDAESRRRCVAARRRAAAHRVLRRAVGGGVSRVRRRPRRALFQTGVGPGSDSVRLGHPRRRGGGGGGCSPNIYFSAKKIEAREVNFTH